MAMKENNMKAKYYLARLLAGGIQYSDTYYSSYKKASEVRSRQVNPTQWMIIVNPLVNSRNLVNVKSEQERQGQKLSQAYKILQELI